MKRKVEKQQSAAPLSAVSAIAARRARQQQQQQQQQQQSSQNDVRDADGETGPPTKRVRSVIARETKGTPSPSRGEEIERLQAPVKAISKDVAFEMSSTDATGTFEMELSEKEEEREVNQQAEEKDLQGTGNDPSDGSSARLLVANSENFVLSKHRLRKSDMVYSDERTLCVRLREKTTLVLIGIYDVWVKKGVISVMGAKLHPSPKTYRVYAPSTHSLPVIKCVSGVEGYAEIELKSCSKNLSKLKDLSPHYSRIWNSIETTGDRATLDGTPFQRSFSILYTSSDDALNRPLRPLHLEKKWSTTLKSLSCHAQFLKVLLCGPKGAGKSTFARYLLNHLLTPAPQAESGFDDIDGVAFLDLDPGQPEFTPMGNIYLAHLREPCFGPPFSHSTLEGSRYGKMVRCHHIGATSPKDDPDNYALAIMDLLHQYRMLLATYPRCPLIINFPGWIFGLGLEVATWLIRSAGLSDVVYMSEKGPTEVVEPLSQAALESRVTFTTLPSQPVDTVTRSSAQLRSMQMQSYFHLTQPEGFRNPYWSGSPLIQSEPIRVSYADSQPGISGIMVLGNHYDPRVLRDIIEGSVVAVVAVENASAFPGVSETEAKSNRDCEILHDSIHEDTADEGGEGEGEGEGKEKDDDENLPDDEKSATQNTTRMKAVLNDSTVRCPNTGLPYLFWGAGSSTPLAPKASRSLGLAFVRSVEVSSQTLELVSPIPNSIIREATNQGQILVLVRGMIDSPDWAFSEEYYAARNAEQDYITSLSHTKKMKKSSDGDDVEMNEQQQTEHLRRLQDRVRHAIKMPYLHVIEDASALHSQENRQESGAWKLRKKVYVSSDSELE